MSKGIIDVVVSDHWPQNVESKECEFEVADFGMNSLENSFSMLTTAATGKLDDQKIVEIMALNPRKILNITAPSISEKNPANLTVFQLDEKWTFDVKKSHSNSRNTPKHPEFNGKIFAVINNELVHINTQ